MTEPMNPAQIAAMVVKLRDRQSSWIGDGTLPDALCRSAADALEAQAAEIARLTALLARNLVMDLGSAEDGLEAVGGWDGVTKIMADRAALGESL
jgi:xanthine/CO dehydrogenase XdhC/CoxF family maturation factor